MSKLLLVEDDETIVENLCVFLQQEGFFVESVFGQKQAIELLEEKYYDLVLLDISLADGNGFAICSYIKQNTDIPVIFLTASGDEYSVVIAVFSVFFVVFCTMLYAMRKIQKDNVAETLKSDVF
ncbi:MAG: response regulator [Clostridium sp.]|nr:response regulator [Clostridium sp.]